MCRIECKQTEQSFCYNFQKNILVSIEIIPYNPVFVSFMPLNPGQLTHLHLSI